MKKKLFLLVPSLVILGGMILVGVNNRKFDEKNQTLRSMVQSAVAAESNTVYVDFGKQIATGSPLVFGGAHTPNPEHQDAWNMIADVGVTMIRRDFYIENHLPKKITIEDYKQNKNDVQNPEKWNKTWIELTTQMYKNAKDRNMKVMAILSYVPEWLSYSGTDRGVPKDWVVYEDLVKKTYKIYRDYIDYIEIWNEPDIEQFLNLKGSQLNRPGAYAQIFEHAVNAINEVEMEINDDKEIKILTTAAATPKNTEIIDLLLSTSLSKHIDGVSIHSYDTDEPSWAEYLNVMKKNNLDRLPIYISEWNKTSRYIKDNPIISTNKSIPFTGMKILQFLKYGVVAANYFSTTQFDPSSIHSYKNSFGYYTINNNGQTNLLPQGKTWRILSKSLALGAGASVIYDTQQPSYLESVGFKNIKSEQGLAVVNESVADMTVQLSLRNLNLPRSTSIKLYIASSSEDGKNPICTQDLIRDQVNPSFWVTLPAESVVGIVMEPPKLSVNSLLHVLGISTSGDCVIGL